MNKAGMLLLRSAVVLVGSLLPCSANVLINEIMYHSPTENLREAYVELYNPDATAVTLNGWRFTKGINYTFPTNTPITLAPGAYLVVASDAATFTTKYPGVNNFVAGWSGAMGSHLRLETAAGTVVNEVHFGNDGDWAARVLTTTVNSFGHSGWTWYAPHDGLGNSLELINPSLPNSYAQNWGSSSNAGGTPGGANSIARTNLAPIITGIAHLPVIPQSTDPVTISARLIDERATGSSLTLYYRNASTATPPAFTALAMFDDGAHGDGLAADGIFAAIVPAQPAGTVIEFYLLAQDAEGNSRVYPNVIPPTTSLRTANLLYQVDEGTYSGAQPLYRIIMTELERAELYQIGRGCPAMDSDAEMNATWITMDPALTAGTGIECRYNASVRNRGHGTRSSDPNNYHVIIPGDRSWKGLSGINLNSQYAHSQVLGSALFRRLGVPMAASRAVQLRVNSTNLMLNPYIDGRPIDTNSFGAYAANEQYNKDFVQRAFPLDPYGNSYRGIRDQTLCDSSRNSVADLSWHGANWAQSAYTNAYFKQNNFLANDFSDLLDLIAVLNTQNGYQAANYAQDVQKRLNVEEWMQYMAITTLLDNDETCLANGTGDDYALYRGTNDTRFLALSYDMDTVLGRGLTPTSVHHDLFRMTNLPVMDKFMKHPAFAPIYYKWLKTYADTAFAPTQMNPLLDQLFSGYLPQGNIDNFKAYNASQVGWVLSRIPLSLTISNSLTSSNSFPYTKTATVALFGTANAISTRQVLVNGAPAAWTAWKATWTNNAVTLSPGLNRVLVQSLDANGVECERAYADIWYDDGSVASMGGTLAADQTWTAAGGPYNVSSTLTIPAGVTLTIQPGTTLYLGSNVNFVVNNGGRLLAEGTPNAPIRFTVAPGSNFSWGGLTLNGAVGSPETRIAYACFEDNANTCIEVAGGTIYLDHTTFGTTTHQYLALDSASFLVSNCHFPNTTASFEPVHGTGGIKAGGRGIIRECFFGTTSGYSDIMDFTGGNREQGQAIIQYYNNVFAGGTDDILDLDGTDAWIEGNIFLHIHRNGAPDSSAAVSGGDNGSDTSQITIIGNLFFDCDNAVTAKQGNFYTLLNNTIVRTTKQGGQDFASGIVNVRDTTPDLTTFGAGCYLEGNIITDAEQLVRNYDPSQSTVTWNNNILPIAWAGPGTNNLVANALLKYIPQLSETYFSNWESAQVMRDWFSLLPGSPARGTGPNGQDKGGLIPIGASLAGPVGTNNQTTATLTAGIVRSGFGIPTAGFPNGSGYIAYKYRLDDGPWSAEIPTRTPITLTGLANGPHHVDVVGKRDCGWYQDDPAFGPEALVTTGRTWVVDTSYVLPTQPTVRLNEILAQNATTLTNAGTTPDLIELYNYGSAPVDLAGMGLSDSAALPYKFTFPAGTPPLNPGQYLTLYADSQTTAPGIHLGFTLKASGDDVYLYDKAASGGALLDSVVFGVQIPDYSLGRGVDGTWVLCQPTFGANNLALPLADPHRLKINEWLADELFQANNDFLELYNPAALPAALGGLFLSNAEGAPGLNRIPDLSFIAPAGFGVFIADNDPAQGADHLNFKLDPNVGLILLSDATLGPIDWINYGPQTTDVSQGRSPSGADTIVNFTLPTAGGPNLTPNGGMTSVTNITSLMVNLVEITNYWRYNNSGGASLSSAWNQPGFDDSTWSYGNGLFGFETTPSVYPYPFRTTIPAPNQANGHITVYYRTHFQWSGAMSNLTLVSTNYVDDGAFYYLNGGKAGAIRMPATFTYNTTSSGQPATEGVPDILVLTNKPVVGDNVLAVEVHQANNTSSDDVFGMQLNAVEYVTNIITSTVGALPVVLNEVLASNQTLTNANATTSDWVELLNTSTNTVVLDGASLSDDPNNPRKFVFAAGTTLGPAEHLLLYCDNNLPASTNNTGFSLNASGGAIYLFNTQSNGGGLLDGVVFGLQVPDFSIGRLPDGTGAWALNVPTPATPNRAASLGNVASLHINEWMADPVNGSDWFELYNSGEAPVSIGGLFFTDDFMEKTMSLVPALSFIGTGADGFAKFIADSNPLAGADHVEFALSKSGEQIGLYSPAGTLIDGVSFFKQATGVSQGRFPDGSSNIISFATTPSPAESNFLPLPDLVINEVLTHTDPPLEDAVEIFNSSSSSVNIGGWFLSNSKRELKKFRIADNTLVAGQGFQVFYEAQFNPTNGSSISFTFNSAHGDRAYLCQADANGNLTGYRAAVSFGAAANGVSFGRFVNSIGQEQFVAMSARSLGVDNPATLDQFRTGTGAPNPAPLVGPVVINEIMFFPPPNLAEDDTQNEFIELLNLTAETVPLFDPLAPTNTWKLKGGVDYTFPQNVTLPPGGTVLLVNFDPVLDPVALATFRTRYSLSEAVPLFGPYSGRLSNSGENLELYRPDVPQAAPHPDAGFIPYILVERIDYLAAAPWPAGADGTGASLQRNVAANYGNDPANWLVAAPTAGRLNSVNPNDTNSDGLPDAWQLQNFNSVTAPQADPGADPDGDGFNNLQEYLAGTDPNLATSCLKIDSVQVAGANRTISFNAVAGKTYSILYKNSLADSTWQRLTNVAAQSASGPVNIPEAGADTPTRFYRLVTPQLP